MDYGKVSEGEIVCWFGMRGGMELGVQVHRLFLWVVMVARVWWKVMM